MKQDTELLFQLIQQLYTAQQELLQDHKLFITSGGFVWIKQEDIIEDEG